VRQYLALTKPRVVQLIVFCAVIGMLLAEPGLPSLQVAVRRHHRHLAGGQRGRGLQLPGRAGHRQRMQRTAWRPTAKGELSTAQTLLFSAVLCAAWAVRCCTGGSTR
jgi:protoheme IX farnesyltransferase